MSSSTVHFDHNSRRSDIFGYIFSHLATDNTPKKDSVPDKPTLERFFQALTEISAIQPVLMEYRKDYLADIQSHHDALVGDKRVPEADTLEKEIDSAKDSMTKLASLDHRLDNKYPGNLAEDFRRKFDVVSIETRRDELVAEACKLAARLPDNKNLRNLIKDECDRLEAEKDRAIADFNGLHGVSLTSTDLKNIDRRANDLGFEWVTNPLELLNSSSSDDLIRMYQAWSRSDLFDHERFLASYDVATRHKTGIGIEQPGEGNGVEKSRMIILASDPIHNQKHFSTTVAIRACLPYWERNLGVHIPTFWKTFSWESARNAHEERVFALFQEVQALQTSGGYTFYPRGPKGPYYQQQPDIVKARNATSQDSAKVHWESSPDKKMFENYTGYGLLDIARYRSPFVAGGLLTALCSVFPVGAVGLAAAGAVTGAAGENIEANRRGDANSKFSIGIPKLSFKPVAPERTGLINIIPYRKPGETIKVFGVNTGIPKLGLAPIESLSWNIFPYFKGESVKIAGVRTFIIPAMGLKTLDNLNIVPCRSGDTFKLGSLNTGIPKLSLMPVTEIPIPQWKIRPSINFKEDAFRIGIRPATIASAAGGAAIGGLVGGFGAWLAPKLNVISSGLSGLFGVKLEWASKAIVGFVGGGTIGKTVWDAGKELIAPKPDKDGNIPGPMSRGFRSLFGVGTALTLSGFLQGVGTSFGPAAQTAGIIFGAAAGYPTGQTMFRNFQGAWASKDFNFMSRLWAISVTSLASAVIVLSGAGDKFKGQDLSPEGLRAAAEKKAGQLADKAAYGAMDKITGGLWSMFFSKSETAAPAPEKPTPAMEKAAGRVNLSQPAQATAESQPPKEPSGSALERAAAKAQSEPKAENPPTEKDTSSALEKAAKRVDDKAPEAKPENEPSAMEKYLKKRTGDASTKIDEILQSGGDKAKSIASTTPKDSHRDEIGSREDRNTRINASVIKT